MIPFPTGLTKYDLASKRHRPQTPSESAATAGNCLRLCLSRRTVLPKQRTRILQAVGNGPQTFEGLGDREIQDCTPCVSRKSQQSTWGLPKKS